jgi:hypothetical protein
MIIGLTTSCADDSLFEPIPVVYLVQDSLIIDGYLKENSREQIIITISPKPTNGDSHTGTLSVVSDQIDFDQIVTIELSRPTFTLHEGNNYLDTVTVSLIPKEELVEPTSASFSIEIDILDEKEIGSKGGDFYINFDYSGKEDMDLMNLREGQIFRYVLLRGSDYFSNNDNFYYCGDTLQLEVLDVDGDRFLISERVTDLSNMKVNNDESYYYYGVDKDATYTNYWIIRNDSLIFEPITDEFKSHLIVSWVAHAYSAYNPNLPLGSFDGEEVQITGWKSSYPYYEGNVKLFTNNYNLLDHYYDFLNILINNYQLAGDLSGYTTVYSPRYGIVKTSTYDFWPSEGIGWDKL